MAKEAIAEVDVADDTTRRRTFYLLDVRATVCEWVRCPTCQGKGLLLVSNLSPCALGNTN